jgi:hypothetical protein
MSYTHLLSMRFYCICSFSVIHCVHTFRYPLLPNHMKFAPISLATWHIFGTDEMKVGKTWPKDVAGMPVIKIGDTNEDGSKNIFAFADVTYAKLISTAPELLFGLQMGIEIAEIYFKKTNDRELAKDIDKMKMILAKAISVRTEEDEQYECSCIRNERICSC